MSEMKDKAEKLCEMKETLTCWASAEIAKGKECVCVQEMGMVIDMIKDLADAEKNCWKACYYKSIVEEMEKYGDNERAGYDHWRYSSGRFAPTGHGHFSTGFTPMDEITRLYNHEKMPNPRMGYVDPMNDNAWGRPMGYDSQGGGSRQDYGAGRYGMSYDKYQDARRHYTASHSKEDKDQMDRHAAEHVADTVVTLKEIWSQADPDTKKKLKGDLGSLMSMINSTP